jgi:glutamate synthase domain-containing protein 3
MAQLSRVPPGEGHCAIHCEGREVRDINRELKRRIAEGHRSFDLSDPWARHNLAVGIVEKVSIRIHGSVGYYCGGLIDGPEIEIFGSAGWGVGESMLTGAVTVHGDAGNGAAASIRGGSVVICGDAAARLGVSMKGGIIVVAGDCGYMAGFMAQKGTIVVCGNAGDAFADSLYATTCFVGGEIKSLGTDAIVEALSSEDTAHLESAIALLPQAERGSAPQLTKFRKIIAGRKLWNFSQTEWKIWQEAL